MIIIYKQKNQGLTLIEVIIVITILSLLFIISMMSWRNQINKARDAQRKEDLQRIAIAFEEYFSDNGCYPPAEILDNCGGPELNPYLDKIPCDPTTKQPYEYVIDPPSACPKNFRVLASLNNTADPAIAAAGCSAETGCGWSGSTMNYGVSSTNVKPGTGITASPSPSASPAGSQPSASPIWYYCQNFSNCTQMPPGRTCNPSFNDPNCGNPNNPCNNIVSSCN